MRWEFFWSSGLADLSVITTRMILIFCICNSFSYIYFYISFLQNVVCNLLDEFTVDLYFGSISICILSHN